MKHLIKLAVGVAIAATVVKMMARRRRHAIAPWLQAADADESLPTVLVADESSVGEGSGDDRVLLPDDGRVRGRDSLNS